jgi:hypothetical protein
MGLPSRFLEKKFFKDEKGDDITPIYGTGQEQTFLIYFKASIFLQLM